MRGNLARDPKGGDTDQLKSVAAGECDVAIVEHVLLRAPAALGQARGASAIAEKVGVVFPNQASWGAHVNISGAGVLKNAPHREAAVKFLEYLASDEAQRYFADGNNEWPVVAGVKVDNPVLARRSASSRPTRSTSRCSAATSRARRRSTTGSPGSNAAAALSPPRA